MIINMVNTLMIWDAEPKEGFQLDSFDKGDYNKAVEQENLARNLVEVLYPNDNHIAGKRASFKTAVLLRICKFTACDRKIQKAS